MRPIFAVLVSVLPLHFVSAVSCGEEVQADAKAIQDNTKQFLQDINRSEPIDAGKYIGTRIAFSFQEYELFADGLSFNSGNIKYTVVDPPEFKKAEIPIMYLGTGILRSVDPLRRTATLSDVDKIGYVGFDPQKIKQVQQESQKY